MAKKRYTLVARVEREIGVLAEDEHEALEKIMDKVPGSWKKGGLSFPHASDAQLLELAQSK